MQKGEDYDTVLGDCDKIKAPLLGNALSQLSLTGTGGTLRL